MFRPLCSLFQRHAWLTLLLLTALLYLPGTGSLPLMDRDEPRFARATVEMQQHGSWVVPYFNSDPAKSDAERIQEMREKHHSAMEVGFRFDKPPLTYWWMRLHDMLLGVNELASRMHSLVSVWLVAVVIFQIGNLVAGRRGAWSGAFGWLTCLQALVHGRLCVADMPMVLMVTLSLWAILEISRDREVPLPRFSRWWWMLWLSLGGGFLAKGPIAVAVPLLAVLLWRWAFWRQPVSWRRWQIGWGGLLTLVLVGSWGIPALIQTQGLFWNIGMGEHVVERGAKALNGRQILPFYYFVSVFLSLLPWIAFLPQLLRRIRQHWDAPTALLVSWFMAPFLIFTPYATQLPHYIMPGFPAFFVLLGTLLGKDRETMQRWKLGRWSWLFLGSIAMLGITVLVVNWGLVDVQPLPLRYVVTSLGVLLISLAGLGLAAGLRSRAGLVASVLALAAALAPVGGWLRQMHPVIQSGEILKNIPATAQLIGWEFTEPSLIFYSDHPWTMLSKLATVQERFQRGKAEAVVLLRREWTLSQWLKYASNPAPLPPSKDFSEMVDAFPTADCTVLTTQGYNLARSSWMELRIIRREAAATPSPTAPQ